jgi:integrase
MPLAAVRAQHVKAYAAQVAARGVARNTVRLAIAPVKAMLATAHEEGILRSNPAAGLRLGRTVAQAPVKTVHALTEQEILRVLAEVARKASPAFRNARADRTQDLGAARADEGRHRFRAAQAVGVQATVKGRAGCP